jgi:hypothetical protein
VTSRLPRRCRCWSLAAAEVDALDGGVLAVVTADATLAREAARAARARGARVRGSVTERRSWKAALNRALPAGPLFGFLRAAANALRARAAVGFRPEPGRSYVLVATLLNQQSFLPDGTYRDTYFGELPERLRAAGLSPLVFGPVTSDAARTYARLGARRDGVPVVPLERFADAAGLLACLRDALAARLLGLRPRGGARFAGRDVSAFVADELRENAEASRLFSDLWFGRATASLLRRVRAERLYYPFENRAWERMVLLAFRAAAPGAPAVGYQHAALTANHLNYVLGAGEAAVLPLPDRIATLGDVTREVLAARGRFPGGLLASACALRQSASAPRRSGAFSARRVLVALATSVREYAAALRLLDDAFAGGGPEVRVRPHPEFPLAGGLALAGPVRFAFADDSGSALEDSFARADAVVYVSSTLGLEAVRRGIPAVRLELDDFLGTDPLEGFDDLKLSARDGAGLRAALARLAALAPAELDARRASAAAWCARYFRPVDAAGLEPFLKTAAFPAPAIPTGALP